MFIYTNNINYKPDLLLSNIKHITKLKSIDFLSIFRTHYIYFPIPKHTVSLVASATQKNEPNAAPLHFRKYTNYTCLQVHYR